MAALLAIADERGKGFIPQKNRIAARKGKASKSLRLLGAKASASSLPTSWDSRDKGWVTPVKDQGNIGTCWAFAANSVLETQLLMAGLGEHNLSEKNMANLNGYILDVDSGGNNLLAEAYLLRWGGSVAETNDVYIGTKSEWTDSPPLIPIFHVQNVVWIPGRESVSDNTTLKTAITNYGAVATSCYWGGYYESTSNYYCHAPIGANHAIAVIGWDDAYPSNNFKRTPPGNGAWLIKNSWGMKSGDNGYFHVSYYDENFAMSEGAVFIPATEDENYDAVYGYDRLGAMFTTDDDEFTDDGQYSIAAAVFTSAWNEEIAAVGVYSNIADNPYEIAVYTNVTRTTNTENPDPLAGGALAAMVSGTLETAGFTTVHLPSPVKIEDGTDFAVVYRQTGSEYPQCYCASDKDEKGFEYAPVDVQPGNTYFGEISGGETNWMDLATKNSVACLKAYTRTTAQSHCDGPEESGSGAAALEWLAVTNAPLYAATSATFGAFAGIVGANGRTLWSSYLAGFDPADPDDGEVVLSISVTNSIPYLSWKPDLGPSARNYTVYGTESLAPSNWQPVDDLSTTKAKYFKVGVSQMSTGKAKK